MRVCQFRHDGKWTIITAARKPPPQEDLRFLFYRRDALCQTIRGKDLSWDAPRLADFARRGLPVPKPGIELNHDFLSVLCGLPQRTLRSKILRSSAANPNPTPASHSS